MQIGKNFFFYCWELIMLLLCSNPATFISISSFNFIKPDTVCTLDNFLLTLFKEISCDISK